MSIEDDNSEFQEEEEGEGQGMIGLFGALLILILSILILFSVINYHQFTYGYSINEASDAIETAIVASAVIVIIVAIIFWVSSEKIEDYIQNKETIEEQELEKIPSLNINELEENKVFALHDASSVIGKNVGVEHQSAPNPIALGLIICGIIAGIIMWEQCDPNIGRKLLSDECYEDYSQNSKGECCKVYPVAALLSFLFFALPGLYFLGPVETETTTSGREQQGGIKKKVVKEKSTGSLVNELNKLNELKEQGILDDDEFKAAKAKLLK